MEAVIALLIIQLVATFAAAGFVWRRFDALHAEIARLREAVEMMDMRQASTPWRSREAGQADLFATVAATSQQSAMAEAANAPPLQDVVVDDPFSDAWVRQGPAKTPPKAPREKSAPRLAPIDGAAPPRSWREPASLQVSHDTIKGGVAALLLALPALGFFFGAPVMAMTLMGIALAALTLLLAMRVDWTAPAWAASLGAGAWALVALETNAAQADTVLFSTATGLAGLAGLAQAALRRRSWSGAMMTLLTAGSALALAAETTFIAPQGIAYGVLVAGAAIIGASRLRRDGLHIAAFAAAGAALIVHSGQADAAIWFTPLAAWAGAIFLGIAAVRVPALGSRGALLAATGVTAALFAAASLAASRQGLAAPLSAAGAYAGLAALFAGIMALAARRAGTVSLLALTAWIMVTAISLALGAAFLIALPLPLAAFAFGLAALAMVGADRLWPDRVWRCFAVCMGVASFATALTSTRLIGASDVVFGPYGQAAFGLALPAALVGLGALTAHRTPNTSGALEAVAIAIALIFFTALTRIVFSSGAPALQPVSLVEAGVHLSLWMGAALALAIRADDGAADVRRAYAFLLSAAAIGGSVIAVVLLFTPYWGERPETALNWAPLAHLPLGLAMPALLAWAHYGYWRWRRAPLRTRFALGAASFLTASLVTFEVALQRQHGLTGVDWTSVSAGVMAFAFAAALHIAPGVTVAGNSGRQLDLEEYLKRHGGR